MDTDTNVDWKRRAEAAERTTTVLKAKVRALYNGDRGAIQRQLDRARQREERMRARRAVVEAKNAALQEHSVRLEGEVAARTRDIQIILDNVIFGFLVVDRETRVKAGYTRSCVGLLGTEDIAGRLLPELLGLRDGSAQQGYLLSIDEVFEDIMPEELTLEQIPGRFVINGRVLQLEGRVIRDDHGEIEGLLMTISDITALEAARRESQENRALIQILKQKTAFRSFLGDCRAQLATARDAVGSNPVFVRRVVHTIKGNAASYGLRSVAVLIHHLEEAETIGVGEIDRIEDALRLFLRTHLDVLEIAYDAAEDEAYEVTPAHLEELQDILDRSDTTALRVWTANLVRKPARLLLGPIEPFVARLAERLDKDVQFTLDGADTMVDCTSIRPIFRNLPHLIRNAIDHGIEPGYARVDKAPVGSLQIEISGNDYGTTITVSDDGRGIDTETLAANAAERGFISFEKASALSREEKLHLIFHDGLSSADQATDISGRGVGMAAVRAAVLSAGGTLTVESTPGQGTTFRISVPFTDQQLAA